MTTSYACVERGHYLVVLHGEQVVGYLGYALCDERIAQAWLEGRYVPTLEECRRGDVLVAMTMHTASREVFSFLIREGRTLLPKVKTVFRRHYGQDKPERLGSHGHDPHIPDLHATFIAAGYGIEKGAKLGEITNTQVAPTIAQLLKLELPEAAGKPLAITAK